MMIREHKTFTKQFRKLSPNLKKKVIATIQLFIENPLEPKLRNHPLQGRMKGKRSLSVTGDVRIIFEEHGNYTQVLMLHVGGHGQVYK